MVIRIINTTGLFSCQFTYEVAEGANWFSIEGKQAAIGKDRLTIDANFQVGAYYKDELGNKYDGFIVDENGVISSTGEIENKEYYFVEEDAMFD